MSGNSFYSAGMTICITNNFKVNDVLDIRTNGSKLSLEEKINLVKLKCLKQGQRDSIVGSTLAFLEINLGSLFDIPYAPSSTSTSDS